MENELWVDIKGYEGYYQISNMGRYKSLDRSYVAKKRNCLFRLKGKIMRPNESRGYLVAVLSMDYKTERFPVHRLVADAFLPNHENKRTVNHKNGNKKDNKLSNLEWATDSEQQLHATKIGLRANTLGEKSNFSKLTENAVIEIRRLFESGAIKTKKELARKFNVAPSNVTFIITRQTWKHI